MTNPPRLRRHSLRVTYRHPRRCRYAAEVSSHGVKARPETTRLDQDIRRSNSSDSPDCRRMDRVAMTEIESSR